MQSLIILHTNDIHGNIEGLARIATMVQQIRRDNPGTQVHYIDAGDIEESSVRLGNVTRGIALHRLLGLAGCQAATVGNGGLLRYGPQVAAEYAQAVSHPLLLANLRWPDNSLLEGTQTSTILQVGDLKLGIIGITSEVDGVYEEFWHLSSPPAGPLVKNIAQQLRNEGAEGIVLLSHMGLTVDRALALELQDVLPLIIGAHTHDVLPTGEQIGNVLVAQAGTLAEYLGRVDLTWDGAQLQVTKARLLPVTLDIVPDPRVMAEVDIIEDEIADFLSEIVGELAQPLDYAEDRECGMANLAVDALRDYMHAEVGALASGVACSRGLPGGPISRDLLWEACPTAINPGIVTMSGAQLSEFVQRGQSRGLASKTPRPLRGQAQGLVHLSGAQLRAGQLFVGDLPVEPEREYRVAASDWELAKDSIDDDNWYLNPEWGLKPEYDASVILREFLETYLTQHSPVRVEVGRIS